MRLSSKKYFLPSMLDMEKGVGKQNPVATSPLADTRATNVHIPSTTTNGIANAPAAPGFWQRSSLKTRVLVAAGLAVVATSIAVGLGVGLTHGGGASGATGSISGTAPLNPLPITPRLFVEGNGIYQADLNFTGFGTPASKTLFLGRGANLQDTRNCRLCETDIPVAETLRIMDFLGNITGVNTVRLTLESDNTSQTLTRNLSYANDVKKIMDHAGTKPNFYTLFSIWIDPSLTEEGWPTNATYTELKELVKLAGNASHVLFGVSNEPQYNYSGVNDTLVFDAMNGAVEAIRQQELALNVAPHIISVQGTRNWAGDVSYYIDHPITAGNGSGVVYELHSYTEEKYFDERIKIPSNKLPMIIGEYGPIQNDDPSRMRLPDTKALMTLARQLKISHLAWTMNPRCGPSLMDDPEPDSVCPVLGRNITMNNLFGQTFLAGMAESWG